MYDLVVVALRAKTNIVWLLSYWQPNIAFNVNTKKAVFHVFDCKSPTKNIFLMKFGGNINKVMKFY